MCGLGLEVSPPVQMLFEAREMSSSSLGTMYVSAPNLSGRVPSSVTNVFPSTVTLAYIIEVG